MIHRLLKGHWKDWYSDGYDGIEPTWSCRICDNVSTLPFMEMIPDSFGNEPKYLIANSVKQKKLWEKQYPGIKVFQSQHIPPIERDCNHDHTRVEPDTGAIVCEICDKTLGSSTPEGVKALKHHLPDSLHHLIGGSDIIEEANVGTAHTPVKKFPKFKIGK